MDFYRSFTGFIVICNHFVNNSMWNSIHIFKQTHFFYTVVIRDWCSPKKCSIILICGYFAGQTGTGQALTSSQAEVYWVLWSYSLFCISFHIFWSAFPTQDGLLKTNLSIVLSIFIIPSFLLLTTLLQNLPAPYHCSFLSLFPFLKKLGFTCAHMGLERQHPLDPFCIHKHIVPPGNALHSKIGFCPH